MRPVCNCPPCSAPSSRPAPWEQDVIPDFRAPQGIRIGLSPLSTSFAELYRGVAAIRVRLAGKA
jgi:kynureninase